MPLVWVAMFGNIHDKLQWFGKYFILVQIFSKYHRCNRLHYYINWLHYLQHSKNWDRTKRKPVTLLCQPIALMCNLLQFFVNPLHWCNFLKFSLWKHVLWMRWYMTDYEIFREDEMIFFLSSRDYINIWIAIKVWR